MDVEKVFINIDSLEKYIEITKDLSKKCKNSKILLNMSTILSLKKARFLEIEYFIKFSSHGAAFIVIERLLQVNRSKTWGLLGKELVSLLQHWLISTRKHLIIMSKNWWSFMNLLLKFIKELRLKDCVLPDILVESTAEPLLDLATRSELDVIQRLDILYCLNLCCADSSREVRFATRHHLENYFVKLSSLLAKSGHVPTQYYMLETLLRWLLPRQNTSVRQAAAAKWFPDTLYNKEAVEIFLERQWQNFYLDARDFLNAHNKTQTLATSVVYRQMKLGSLTIECSPRRESWLDINPATKSITVLLEPRMMEILGVTDATMQTLVINEDIVVDVKLARNALDVTIAIKTSNPLHVYPSNHAVGDGGDVAVVVSERNDMRRLDYALRNVFGDKYEVLIDFEEVAAASPRERNKRIISSSEEDTRFSHPVRPTRRKVSGYVTKSASTWKSPSSTSTTSLALLHDRLEALPKFKFNKEPVKVAALPDLSIVSELTEIIDTQSIASGTSNNKPYRGAFKNLRKSEKKSQSDGEAYSSKKYISPVVGVKEDHNPSCLLVATIGSNESVINDTIQSLSKNKDYESDNIVDLLLKEALQSKDDKLDSGINTGENRKSPELRDSDAIEDTPNLEQSKSLRNREITVSKNDLSEECNEIDESQFDYVTVRKKVLIDKHKEIEEDIQKGIDANEIPAFDEEAVERFFSEHITEDRSGGIVVSPTLARKINETSSDGSDDFQDCLVEHNYPSTENLNKEDISNAKIIDCLNNIIDKVCHDIEKCAEILEKDNSGMENVLKIVEMKEVDPNDNLQTRVPTDIENFNSENNKNVETPKNHSKQKKVMKLKFKTKRIPIKPRSKKENNSELARKLMTPIPENRDSSESEIKVKNHNVPEIIQKEEKNAEVSKTIENIPAAVPPVESKDNDQASTEIKNISPSSTDLNMPLIRRRRKLYSPKDEHEKTDIQNDNTEKHGLEVHHLQDDDRDDFKSDSKKSPKYAATCYKDIEKVRKRHIRLPKSRKSRGKSQTRSPSPRTKKMQHFSNLKANVEDHVDIILADKKRQSSPRTKKMNELFDNLKTNVEEHSDIILADKKFNKDDLAKYNFTSDSEDDDFKKKKVEMKKRISTTTNASGDSMISRQGRIINKINYSERSSDEKPRQTKNKNIVRRKKASRRRPYNLADEKMREAQKEDLNISLVLEKDNELLKDPEPILETPPRMEVIGSELDEPIAASRAKRTVKKKKKVNDKKEAKLNIDKDNDDRTLSPLPGLVIEKVPPCQDNANDSVCTQVMDKLKRMCKEGPDAVDESNTTQNMLLDIEKTDFSQQYISNNFDRMSPIIPDNTEIDTYDAKPKTRRNNAILNDTENVIEVISFEKNTEKRSSKIDGGIVNICDVTSERSIATVGQSPINAHGNIDEEPPDKGHLNKRVQSRNLELEDMDTSIKDYYLQLREEINKPLNSSHSSSENVEVNLAKKKIEKCSQQCISPVMQMQKMTKGDTPKKFTNKILNETKIDSVENISHNVSRKSISPVASWSKITYDLTSNSKPRNYGLDKTNIDLVKKSSDNGSGKCISPVVSLTKMSYDDISKWLPSRRNSYDSSEHSSEKSKITDKVEDKNNDVSEKSVSLRTVSNVNVKNLRSVSRKPSDEVFSSSRHNANKQISKENQTKTSKNITLHYNLRSAPKPISSTKRLETDRDCNNNDDSVTTRRKTMISPIKLFDDLLKDDNDLIPSTSKKATDKTNKPIEIKSPVLNISASSKRFDLQKSSVRILRSDSNISSSTRVDGKTSVRGTIKRKSESPEEQYSKKRRIEVLTDSGPSMSSIDDWLMKSAPISAVKSVTDAYGESLQNIIEKLDTTLAEIHQNTSKNFVHLFVEAQRHLSEARAERRRTIKLVATEVIQEVVSILERKFGDLDKRTQEIDTDFMEQLKSRAAEFIREDCKKKRVMVALLREDIKAAYTQGLSQDTQTDMSVWSALVDNSSLSRLDGDLRKALIKIL